MPRCQEKGVGVVVGGVFSSASPRPVRCPAPITITPPPTSHAAAGARIQAVCARHGVPLPAAALQFPLGHPAVAAVIPGAVSAAQVADNLRHMRMRYPAISGPS